MKKISSFLIAILFVCNLGAQNSYTVNAGNFYYYPMTFNINIGDTVLLISSRLIIKRN